MRPNLGYLYWRECYSRGDNARQIETTLEKLLRQNRKETPLDAPYGFDLKLNYPGLLIGTGYLHGIGGVDVDFKSGFYFDHTSGLPVIPGSSVKGILRSLFGLPMKGRRDPYADAKHAMIRDYLSLPDNFDVAALARAIFEGIDEEGEPLGIYRRDIFYDARVVTTEGRLLADDYITPHPSPIADPKPIRILKVAPGVSFAFRFRLCDTTIGEHTVTAETKAALFLILLHEFGAGAKTNVGYGNFQLPAECEQADFHECLAYLRQRNQRIARARAEEQRRRQEEKERQERLARLSPLERKLEALRPAEGSNEKFSTRVLKAIEEDEFDEEERCEALRYLRRIMEEEKIWKPTSQAKNPAKDKAHKRTLKIMEMIEKCR